jgi:uncharacterized OB-fold protein
MAIWVMVQLPSYVEAEKMNLSDKPLSQSTALTQPYWAAAREGQLVLQCCAACAVVRHYPRLLCDRCYASAVNWIPASGKGTVHSWTVAHHAFHPAFAADLPYTLVTVDLEEGVRALGRWQSGEQAGSQGVTLAIGTPVQGRFEVDGDRADLIFSALKS